MDGRILYRAEDLLTAHGTIDPLVTGTQAQLALELLRHTTITTCTAIAGIAADDEWNEWAEDIASALDTAENHIRPEAPIGEIVQRTESDNRALHRMGEPMRGTLGWLDSIFAHPATSPLVAKISPYRATDRGLDLLAKLVETTARNHPVGTQKAASECSSVFQEFKGAWRKDSDGERGVVSAS